MIRNKIVFSILLLLLFISFWLTPIFAQNQTGGFNNYEGWWFVILFDNKIQGMINREKYLPPHEQRITDCSIFGTGKTLAFQVKKFGDHILRPPEICDTIFWYSFLSKGNGASAREHVKTWTWAKKLDKNKCGG